MLPVSVAIDWTLLVLLTVQEKSAEGTRFCFLVWTVSESDILWICSNIYIWFMADYQSRPVI